MMRVATPYISKPLILFPCNDGRCMEIVFFKISASYSISIQYLDILLIHVQ